MNLKKVYNLATPIDSGDAATKGYVDSKVAAKYSAKLLFVPNSSTSNSDGLGTGNTNFPLQTVILQNGGVYKVHETNGSGLIEAVLSSNSEKYVGVKLNSDLNGKNMEVCIDAQLYSASGYLTNAFYVEWITCPNNSSLAWNSCGSSRWEGAPGLGVVSLNPGEPVPLEYCAKGQVQGSLPYLLFGYAAQQYQSGSGKLIIKSITIKEY